MIKVIGILEELNVNHLDKLDIIIKCDVKCEGFSKGNKNIFST